MANWAKEESTNATKIHTEKEKLLIDSVFELAFDGLDTVRGHK